VLATDVGAMREAIEDGVTGFVIPEESCEAGFVLRILALDRDRERLHEISRAASEGARDWATATTQLRAWLEMKWEVTARDDTRVHSTERMK
jgi:glycosyltransferase involved in cell wall biosynthesis